MLHEGSHCLASATWGKPQSCCCCWKREVTHNTQISAGWLLPGHSCAAHAHHLIKRHRCRRGTLSLFMPQTVYITHRKTKNGYNCESTDDCLYIEAEQEAQESLSTFILELFVTSHVKMTGNCVVFTFLHGAVFSTFWSKRGNCVFSTFLSGVAEKVWEYLLTN